jgi:hypothetical protein
MPDARDTLRRWTTMPRRQLQNSALVLTSIVVSLAAIELGARWFIVPAENAYGTLFGRELPPVRIITSSSPPPRTDLSAWHEPLIVDDRKISRGDLWGFHEEDPLLGFTHEENAVSSNGWWQSNNIGARARFDVGPSVPPGQARVLVFGESFAHGSRVPQEAAWPNIMDSEHGTAQVLNLAVDGYSMAQSFLRYRKIRTKIDYDVAILMFVPEADLWRDVNTIRDLAEDWKPLLVVPRFVVVEDDLRLVRSPYETVADLYPANGDGLSDELRNHLLKYDRFYFRTKYEEPPLIGGSILYKMMARSSYLRAERALRDSLWDPESEALQVSRRIFEAMNEEVRRDGGEFLLVVLPVDHGWWDGEYGADTVEAWEKMISFVCAEGMRCVDLLDHLRRVPPNLIDRGYDASHFGPKANRLIAELIWGKLVRMGLVH